MKVRKVSPKYFNAAGMDEAEDIHSWNPAQLFLRFNKWHEIPTKEDEDIGYGKEGGTLDDLILIPGKNIQADLVYQGEIECVDFEDRSCVDEHLSYPPENPLFHSGNLGIVKDRHYRFTTKYMPAGKPIVPNLETARNLSGGERKSPVLDAFSGLEETSDLFYTLRSVFENVVRSKNGNDREDGFYEFDELFDEYRRTGKVSGDCKAISTFTAGIIESLGLRARIIDGNIHFRHPEIVKAKGKTFEVYQGGHVWTEAFIPQDAERGYWVPVDPAFGAFLVFPNEPDRYSLSRIELPYFKDQSKETARLKLQYI